MMRLVVPGTLPTMNEIIEAAKKHPAAYSQMKKEYTDMVAWATIAARIPQIERGDFTITWHCPDRRNDKDNIMAGQKFIFDGIVTAGKMGNDGWKQIGDVTHRFGVDKANPRVEIDILA